MPELPEVETVVRQLTPTLPGHRIQGVDIFHPDLLRDGPGLFRQAVQGATIEFVDRRGKNILMGLGEPGVLVVNLGMTGKLLLPTPGDTPDEGDQAPSHLGVVFRLDPHGTLLYADTRRFGSLRVFDREGWAAESARMGPEPLGRGLTREDFHASLARSRSPIRSWLLDQTKVAGIGNIYASEALFRARVHPRRPARSLSASESGCLLNSLRDVLEDAIRARGTTLRDYRTASGDKGGFGPSLQAYGQAGVPCPRCNTLIERIVFGNRSAFLCPRCQTNP